MRSRSVDVRRLACSNATKRVQAGGSVEALSQCLPGYTGEVHGEWIWPVGGWTAARSRKEKRDTKKRQSCGELQHGQKGGDGWRGEDKREDRVALAQSPTRLGRQELGACLRNSGWWCQGLGRKCAY